MNIIDSTDDFMDRVASLQDSTGPEKLLMVELLKYEQEMETQGTEHKYKDGMNDLLDAYLRRQEKK